METQTISNKASAFLTKQGKSYKYQKLGNMDKRGIHCS